MSMSLYSDTILAIFPNVKDLTYFCKILNIV